MKTNILQTLGEGTFFETEYYVKDQTHFDTQNKSL